MNVIQRTPSSSHVARVFRQVEQDLAPSAIVASWRRCIKVHGLKPDGFAKPDKREHRFVAEACERNEAMIRAAADIIDHLISVLAGPDYMIFLTDAHGIVLEAWSPRASDFWGRPRSDWKGTDFGETSNGTNGIGTVLRDKRPMTVAADQHFLMRNIGAVCSGAPIYGPDGHIAGCIDISSSAGRDDALANSLMLATAVETARCIELRMLAAANEGSKLVMASHVGHCFGAFLAVDRNGGVVGATRSATVLLGLKPQQLNGMFSVEQLWRIEDKRDLSWRAGESRMIEAALARHNGNTSAAARTLGISRSTLNRKITDLKKSRANSQIF